MQSNDSCLATHADNHLYLVASDPFWPTIDLRLIREQLQLPADIGHARLEVAARVAASSVVKEFLLWRQALRGRGYKTLLDLAGDGKRPTLAQLYWRAVAEATRFELGKQVTVVDCPRRRPNAAKGARHE